MDAYRAPPKIDREDPSREWTYVDQSRWDAAIRGLYQAAVVGAAVGGLGAWLAGKIVGVAALVACVAWGLFRFVTIARQRVVVRVDGGFLSLRKDGQAQVIPLSSLHDVTLDTKVVQTVQSNRTITGQIENRVGGSMDMKRICLVADGVDVPLTETWTHSMHVTEPFASLRRLLRGANWVPLSERSPAKPPKKRSKKIRVSTAPPTERESDERQNEHSVGSGEEERVSEEDLAAQEYAADTTRNRSRS